MNLCYMVSRLHRHETTRANAHRHAVRKPPNGRRHPLREFPGFKRTVRKPRLKASFQLHAVQSKRFAPYRKVRKRERRTIRCRHSQRRRLERYRATPQHGVPDAAQSTQHRYICIGRRIGLRGNRRRSHIARHQRNDQRRRSQDHSAKGAEGTEAHRPECGQADRTAGHGARHQRRRRQRIHRRRRHQRRLTSGGHHHGGADLRGPQLHQSRLHSARLPGGRAKLRNQQGHDQRPIQRDATISPPRRAAR